jgi:hypothetical protein
MTRHGHLISCVSRRRAFGTNTGFSAVTNVAGPLLETTPTSVDRA